MEKLLEKLLEYRIYFTVDDKGNKQNITKEEYDKKHVFNNKVFHRTIIHVK